MASAECQGSGELVFQEVWLALSVLPVGSLALSLSESLCTVATVRNDDICPKGCRLDAVGLGLADAF